MKFNKSLLVAAALIGGMLTSCSDSEYWDQASSAELGNGQTYSFSSPTVSYTYEGTDQLKDTDVNITITRGTTNGQVTIPVKVVVTDPNMMSAPDEVTFEDGSNTASFPIHFKEELVPGVDQAVKLTLDSKSFGFEEVEKPAPLTPESTHEDSLAYVKDSIAYGTYQEKLSNYQLQTIVSFKKNLTWVECGSCTFADYTVSETPATAENVPIMNGLGTNKYRIINPWVCVYGEDATGATNIEFTLDENYQMTLVTDGSSSGVVTQFTLAGDGAGAYTFCWPAKFAAHCSVVSQGNVYQASMLGLFNGEGYYPGFSFAFMWTTGWPGSK